MLEGLAAGRYCAKPADILRRRIADLTPPDRISTVDCAERYRKMPATEGGANVGYDRWRTPYNVGPMNDMDLPTTRLGVLVKPSRSGGSTIAENLAFKMMMFGPMGHIGWYLNSKDAVTEYCRTVVQPMFNADTNPDLAAKIGGNRGDNNDAFKRVSGYPVEYLAAGDSGFRNRQPMLMVLDESDAYAAKFASSPRVQIEGRQKLLGSRRKAMILSHPDRGWNSGVANAWVDTSRGIYIMRCVECRHFAAAHATKHWPDVAEFKLHYQQRADGDIDTRLQLAQESAAMLCPHCGALLDDDQRRTMIDEALAEGWGSDGWMHRGQMLDPVDGIIGEREVRDVVGWWEHGLMLKTTDMPTLARDLVKALDLYERTKDAKQLRELLSKQFGEVFEGAAITGGLSERSLRQAARESTYRLGEVPPGVRFITAAVDTGGRKFDVAWIGWDLEGRSWLIDRVTIRQRIHADGIARDIDVYRRFEDWLLLLPQVVDRTFPLIDRPGWALPVAVTCIDDGDGNATWMARQFQRVALKSHNWAGWSKTKLVKGSRSPLAGYLPNAPRKVDRDEEGKVVALVFEFDLGVHRLKLLTHERLAVADGGPGQCHFPIDVDGRHIKEFFGESLVDEKWVRTGPNETLDLYGYAEAGRLMLAPDRRDIKWTGNALPIWAKPVPVQTGEGGDLAVAGEGNEESTPSRWSSLLEDFDD